MTLQTSIAIYALIYFVNVVITAICHIFSMRTPGFPGLPAVGE